MPSATRAADIQAQSTPPRQATPVLSTRPLQTPIPSTRPVDPAPLTRIPAFRLTSPSGSAMPFGDSRIPYAATGTMYAAPALRC